MREEASFVYCCFAVAMLLLLPITALRTPAHRMRQIAPICRALIFFVACTYVAVMAGGRGVSAGFDTASYVQAYEALGPVSSAHQVGEQSFGSTELLFWPAQAVLKAVGLPPPGWLLALCVTTFVLMAICYSQLAGAFGLSYACVALVLCTYELVYLGNAVRQMLALPFGVMSVLAFDRRRYGLAGTCLLIAAGFHWSSLVFGLAPLLGAGVFKSRKFVLAHVALMLAIAQVSILDGLSFASQFVDPIRSKVDYYSVSESHITAIYQTANFWICVVAALCVVWRLHLFSGRGGSLFKCFFLFFSLMLVGLNQPDFAERFMAQALFFVPLVILIVLNDIRMRVGVRAYPVLFFATAMFVGLGWAVLGQQSTRITLGL